MGGGGRGAGRVLTGDRCEAGHRCSCQNGIPCRGRPLSFFVVVVVFL